MTILILAIFPCERAHPVFASTPQKGLAGNNLYWHSLWLRA